MSSFNSLIKSSQDHNAEGAEDWEHDQLPWGVTVNFRKAADLLRNIISNLGGRSPLVSSTAPSVQDLCCEGDPPLFGQGEANPLMLHVELCVEFGTREDGKES